MKILLTNNHLNTFGGTENWVWTVYTKLKEKGHSVDVYALQVDNSEATKRFDKVFASVPRGEKYDLVLCNHNSCLIEVLNRVNADKVKFISHGTIPQLEQPLLGADEYVSISEEVKTHLAKLGYKSTLIRNPIDLDRFYPTEPLREVPETLFSLCQGQKALDQLRLHFPALEVRTIPTSREKRVTLNRDHYNASDVCVGLGRSAMEGLACGRPVLIYDWRHYMGEKCDGMITPKNSDVLITKNYSGRVFGGLDISLRNYSSDSDQYRSIAEKHFDSEKIVEQLIS